MKKAIFENPAATLVPAEREAGNSLKAEKSGNSITPKLAVTALLFTFLLFANTINQYLFMDDFDVLYSAKYNDLKHVLLGYDTVLIDRFFRPIPMFSFWLQGHLFGFRPPVFHFTNVLLHALTAILAANLFFLLFRNLRAAAVFALVFIAFPNHGEVVHSTAINFTPWCALFYLAGLNLFGYYRLSSRYSFMGLSILAFLAAVLSKELAYTLPISLIVLDVFLSRSRSISLPLRRRAMEYCAFFLVLFLSAFIVRKLLKIGTGYLTLGGEDLVSFYLNNIFALGGDLIRMYTHMWKYLIVPISPEFRHADWAIAVICAAAAVSCGLLIWKRRLSWSALAFSLLFGTIALLPVLGTYKLLKLTHWIRFLYLPSVAGCYIIAMIIDGFMSFTEKRWLRYALLSAAIIPMALLTKFYDNQWIKAERENKRVMEKVVEKLNELPRYSRVYVSGIPWSKNEIPRIDYGFKSAAGLYFDREYLEADLYFLPALKVLPLEREPYGQQDWHYFHFVWNDDGETLEAAESIQPKPNNEPPLTLDFSDRKLGERMEIATDIIRIGPPTSPYPLFMIDGSWALLKFPAVNIRGPVKYLTIEMMLKEEAKRKDASRIFWVTDDDLKYTGGKSIGFFVKADGQFHAYRVPIYRNGLSLIDPHILRFAIRPSQNQGAVFSIKRVTMEFY